MTNDIRIRPRALRDDGTGSTDTDARTPWPHRPYIAWPATAALLTALLFLLARINAPAVFRFDEDPEAVRVAVEKTGSADSSWDELTCDGNGNFRLRPGEYRLALRSGPFTLFDGRMVLDGHGVWRDGETEFDFDRLTRRLDVSSPDPEARVYLDGMRADSDAAASQTSGSRPAASGVGKSDQTIFRLPDRTFCVFAVSGRKLSDIRFPPVDPPQQTETIRIGEYPHEFLPGIDAENDEVILAFFRRLRAPGWVFWETYAPGKKEELIRLFVETFCEKDVVTEMVAPNAVASNRTAPKTASPDDVDDTDDAKPTIDANPVDSTNETDIPHGVQVSDVLDTIFQEPETILKRLADLETKIQEEIVQAAMRFVQESRDDPETRVLLQTLLADEFARLSPRKTETGSATDETVPETTKTTEAAEEGGEKRPQAVFSEPYGADWRFYCIEGYCLLCEERPEEAKTVLERAVATAPDHALPQGLLARVLVQLNAFGDARAAVDRALECDDVVRADALTIRATLELKEAERVYDGAERNVLVEKSRQALEDLNAAAACDRVFPETFFLRSLVQSALGREKEAGEDWIVFEGRLGDRGPAESARTLERAEKERRRWKQLVKTESWGGPSDENH